MSGWQHHSGALHYQSPDRTVTIDHISNHPTDAPAQLLGLSPFVLWEWAKYRVTVAPPIQNLRVRYGDKTARSFGSG